MGRNPEGVVLGFPCNVCNLRQAEMEKVMCKSLISLIPKNYALQTYVVDV
jgi:hypothetical protein